MDKTTLFNLALSLIGEARYTEQAGVQHPCELWYPLVMREASVRHNWSFARRLTRLTRQADGTYHLPADCMNILYFRDATSRSRPSAYTLIGRQVHTDLTGPVLCVYQTDTVATMQELPDSSPEFCTAVAYLLAARVSRRITGGYESAEFCEQMAEVQFLKAITRDAQAEASNKTDPFAAESDPVDIIANLY